MKIKVTERFRHLFPREEVVEAHRLVDALCEQGIPAVARGDGVYAPMVYDPQADTYYLAEKGTYHLVAPRVLGPGEKMARVVVELGRWGDPKLGEVFFPELLVERLTGLPGSKAWIGEDGVYANLVQEEDGKWRVPCLSEGTPVRVAEFIEPPKPEASLPPALPALEDLPRLLREARERDDLAAVDRLAWAFRKEPLEVQERVRQLLQEVAYLDQEGNGPLDGVYALGWKEE